MVRPVGRRWRIVLRTVGGVVSALALYLAGEGLVFQAGAERVNGERVGELTLADGQRQVVVRYEVNGRAYETRSRRYSTGSTRGGAQGPNELLRHFEPIPVLYRPGQPEAGRIATPIELWGLPFGAGVFGAASLLVGFSRGGSAQSPQPNGERKRRSARRR